MTLAAAVRADADAVFVEPSGHEGYTITFERSRTTLVSTMVDAVSATAAIARLAYVARLDLSSSTVSSSLIVVRSGERCAEIVVTIRPGGGLRADLMVVPGAGQHRTPPEVRGEPGEVIGNYRILDWLGQGGMGSVYRVEHVVLGRCHALKVLHSTEFQRDSMAARQFLREARAAARVRHPNIVDVFDVGHVADGRPYFVMELLDGETLEDLLSSGPLEPHEAVTIAHQLASALAAVHDRGVVHGDVTPSNAMVVERSPIHVKLVDFGLSAIAGETAVENPDGFVLGTPSYISPEQLCGLPATDRSDQYGLGCVMYSLLVGHPPYQHERTHELAKMHVHAAIPKVDSLHGPLPPKLADVITTCLQKSPQQRFPGMRALLAALEDIMSHDLVGWRRWLG